MLALLGVAPTLTLGPASLPMAELAEALTKAGMPTETAPVLRDRGAFVCLRDRSPEAVRAILGEALGVAFKPQNGGWLMTVAPEAKERERLFLAQYRRQAVEKAREWAAAQDALREGRSYAKLDADVQGASKAFENAGDPPDAATKAGLRRLFAFNTLMTVSTWTGVPAFRDATAVGAAIERPVRVVTPTEKALATYGLPLSALGEPSPRALVTTLDFDPLTGFLTNRASGVGGEFEREFAPYPFRAAIGPYAVNGTGGTAETRVEGVTLVETFNRMGQTAGDYLRGFAAAPPLPATPVAKGPMPATLSRALDRLGVEAVMELSPRFEGLPVREMPPQLSLRDALAIPAFPKPPLSRAPDWLMELVHPEDREGVVARARTFPWRVRTRDGVFEIVDPLAFLDRAQWISPVPYLLADRVLATLPADAPRGFAGERLLDWPRLVELSKLLPPGETLARADGYRGLGGVVRTVALLPVVRAVEALPPTDRATLWKADGKDANVRTAGGALTLRIERMEKDFRLAAPIACVHASWKGDDGTVWSVEGSFDPRGSF